MEIEKEKKIGEAMNLVKATEIEKGIEVKGSGISRGRYANLMTDFMFKKVFGNKEIMKGFLKMMLPEVEIADITYLQTEMLGESADDRRVIFDLRCITPDKKEFIVEMQRAHQKYFKDRALLYTAYPILRQARIEVDSNVSMNYVPEQGGGDVADLDRNKAAAYQEGIQEDNSCLAAEYLDRLKLVKSQFRAKGRWNYRLQPIYFIALMDFTFHHDDSFPESKYLSSYRLHEDETGEVFNNILRYVFVELPRFKKKESDCVTLMEKVIYSIKHMHEFENQPSTFSEDFLNDLFSLSNFNNFAEKEKKEYMETIFRQNDWYNVLDTAREEGEGKGYAKGREEGRVEGREEGRVEIVRRMSESGMDVEMIARIVGVGEDDVREMLK